MSISDVALQENVFPFHLHALMLSCNSTYASEGLQTHTFWQASCMCQLILDDVSTVLYDPNCSLLIKFYEH